MISGALTRRVTRTAAAIAFATTVAANCGPAPPSGGTTAAPPPTIVAVGPVPGPPGSAEMRSASETGEASNPYHDNRTAMTEGRQLFVRFNCSGCHGGRAGGGMGPSLRDVDWLYGRSDAQIFSSIVEGRAHGMPSWQTRLTADQVWKLVTYIKSLRTRDEPQAPPVQ
jgi:cytochrome c oxidase cbb3-type subunit 3